MKSLFSLAMFLLFIANSSAQEEGENLGFDQYSSSVFDSREASLNLVSKMTNNNAASMEQNALPTGILIQQIGDFNAFNANIRATTANISVLQNGNDNSLLVDKEANSINQRVLQNGNNNQISDFTYYTRYDVNMEMVQQGNNQSIQNYGTNSLSQDMKVTQTGNGAAVIIINQ